MSHTTSFKNKSYLAITATISAGILSGCDYCTPVLMALLTIPAVNLIINHIIKSHQSTLNLHGLKESAS